MITYFDASALVKRYVNEPNSDQIRKLATSGYVATARSTGAEIASALARRCREKHIATQDRDRALEALETDFSELYVVELTPRVDARARDLLTRHTLRASDAVQLASSLELKAELKFDVGFAAFDARLVDAARDEGLSIAIT